MKTIEVALIILENEEQEILFLLRDKDKDIPFPDHWDLIGGHVEEGESAEEALRREVKEEIGYDLKEFSFFKEYDVKKGDVFHNVKYVYEGKIIKLLDELQLGNEGQKLQFFSYGEIPELKLANVIKGILVDYIETQKS